MPQDYDPDRLSLGALTAIYFGLLFGWLGLAVLLAPRLGLPIGRALFGLAGLTYWVAATGHPQWLFNALGTITRLTRLHSAATVRLVLAVFGGLLLLLALLAPPLAR